jgi:hypothetical protein
MSTQDPSNNFKVGGLLITHEEDKIKAYVIAVIGKADYYLLPTEKGDPPVKLIPNGEKFQKLVANPPILYPYLGIANLPQAIGESSGICLLPGGRPPESVAEELATIMVHWAPDRNELGILATTIASLTNSLRDTYQLSSPISIQQAP